MWDGHPNSLTDQIVESALVGALPKPLFEFPAAASAVKKAIVKRDYATALTEAAKLGEADGGAEFAKVVQSLVTKRVETMKSALAKGDFLTAQDMAAALAKQIDGLPEASEAERVKAEVKANKDAARVITGQKKIRALRDGELRKKKELDKAIGDLDKLAKEFAGTYVATEAGEFREELVKRRGAL